MTARPLTIAVTGLNATDNPAPGVPVIRALRAAAPECRVVGLAYDALDPGCYMEGVADDVYLMPFPSMGAEAIYDRLLTIHARTPIDVLLPTLDSELAAYVKLRPRLAEAGIRTFLPDADMLALRDKERLSELSAFGVNVPKSVTLTDPRQIDAIGGDDSELSYPVMVKGRFYEAYAAYTPSDVRDSFHKIATKWGVPVVVQQLIPGDEFDVVCVGDGDGGLIGSVAMRKMQLTDRGKAWGGVTVSDPELTAFVRDTVAALRWRGPCELEIMRASGDGALYLIEINPRFPAWVYLTVGAERNLPWATVRLALGERVDPMPPAQPGVMFLRHSLDQILTLQDYEALTIGGELHRPRQPEVTP